MQKDKNLANVGDKSAPYAERETLASVGNIS